MQNWFQVVGIQPVCTLKRFGRGGIIFRILLRHAQQITRATLRRQQFHSFAQIGNSHRPDRVQ